MTKTMVIFKRGAIFLCCVRCDPIPPQTSVQRLAHTRNVTTCCWEDAESDFAIPFVDENDYSEISAKAVSAKPKLKKNRPSSLV